MKSFKFRKRILELEIEGQVYQVACNSSIGKLAETFEKDFTAMSHAIETGEKTESDCIALFETAINSLLGENAFQSIFETLEPTVDDCAELLLFVTLSATEFMHQRNLPYEGK